MERRARIRGKDMCGKRAKDRPFFQPGITDTPLGGAVDTRKNDLLPPLPGEPVVVIERWLHREDLARRAREEALFDLPDHALYLPLGLGSIRAAGFRYDIQRLAQFDPLGSEHDSAVTGTADAKIGIAVSEDLFGNAAEIIQTGDNPLQRRGTSAIGGKADTGCATVSQDDHHPEEFNQTIVQWEQAKVRPVHLDLDAWIGFKAYLGLDLRRGTQAAKVTGEGGIAALVAVVGTQLQPQIAAADGGTDRQPSLNMSELCLGEFRGLGTLGIAPRFISGKLSPNSRARALIE
jgi:hypothetical protein